MLTACEFCKKEFDVDPSRLKRGSGKYCSRDCLRKAKAKTMASAVCLTCGKAFEYYPASSRGKYCARECSFRDYSKIAKENHAKNHESWTKVTDEQLLKGWEEFRAGKFKKLNEMTRSLGYDHDGVPMRLRKIVPKVEYRAVMDNARESRKRQYTEEEVRVWFEKWLASHRPLREMQGDNVPHFHELGRLFKRFFPVEYEDAIERKNGKGYQIGRAFEYQCRDKLRAKGFVVFRSPRSLSAADLVALRRGEILLVQCKTRRDSLKPKEREDLQMMADAAGAVALLAWRGRKRHGINWERLDGISFQLV